MSQTGLVLKKGKEKPLLQRHHWIYSGAIRSLPPVNAGLIVPVFSAGGEKLGLAALNPGRSIAAHMLSFGTQSVEEALSERIRGAISLRKGWFDLTHTNAFRLINAEGDGIPGLIVDSYNGRLVMQISHRALESFREEIIALLIQEASPISIYEKSTSFLRKKEGMGEVETHQWGEDQSLAEFRENGLVFRIDVKEGQKTGWFLDQREMRKQVGELAAGRRILNVFAYTGGFSVAALAAGATTVDSVEISAKCQPLLEENLSLNGCSLDRHQFFCEDAFAFLKKSSLPYDLAILDPPAFAKKRDDVPAAFRAYKELNRLALEKLPAGALLMTCSCSYHIDEALFQNIVFRGALEAKRSVRIVGRHRQALDHPISLYHPESSYLKSLLLYVD